LNGCFDTLPRGYHLCCHAELGDVATQIHHLASLAFGSYPGVKRPSVAHRDWYLRRPGMDSRLSMAVVHRDQLVCSVFVTVQRVRLGGDLRPVGIIDTVMTHPEHRRRGLARSVLSQAIKGMQKKGLSASLLYTVAGSMPYRFYQQLGYRPHAPVYNACCVSEKSADVSDQRAPGSPGPTLTLWQASRADGSTITAFLNDHYRTFDGYVPLDDALWRWRKMDRPDELPADSWFVSERDRLLGCVTICRAPIVSASGAESSYVLTDLAIGPEADPRAILEALLSPVPKGGPMRILLPQANRRINALLFSAGFQKGIGEVCMVLPLDSTTEQVLTKAPRRWYALTESVIGV